MRILIFILMFTCACRSWAQVNIITTICGNDTAAYGGDNHAAIKAKLNDPYQVCLDKAGNIYIADAGNNRIRKITINTGIITTVAGTGKGGFSGDGGPATDAELWIPEAVFTDKEDNLYIADAINNRVRKVSASSGLITTVAGIGPSGSPGTSSIGDGGPATDAAISMPSGICIDGRGDMYIADYGNNKVRKIDCQTGIITTIAGVGTSGYLGGFVAYGGDGGIATDAKFSGALNVYVDSKGDIFICDQWNHAVRRIDALTHTISTIAGNGIAGYAGDGGVATNAQLNEPSGVFVDDDGDIFIAENGAIKKVSADTKVISTVAGTGMVGYSGDEGPATDAKIVASGLFLDKYGTLFIADYSNNRIRMVYDTALHVSVNEINKNKVRIYPNPASNELIVEGAEGSEVSIWNMVGQSFYKHTVIKSKEAINISTLIPAMYLIEIVGSSGSKEIHRFVKE